MERVRFLFFKESKNVSSLVVFTRDKHVFGEPSVQSFCVDDSRTLAFANQLSQPHL
jgi:hypothetical protein